jgi:hypothetical protein
MIMASQENEEASMEEVIFEEASIELVSLEEAPDLEEEADLEAAVPRSAKPRAIPRCSMGLRKLPVDILLLPSCEFSFNLEDSEASEAGDDTLLDNGDNEEASSRPPLFRRMCINPRYFLKTQLMLSFGTVNFLTILFVVIICIVAAFVVGENITSINQDAFEGQARDLQSTTARYLAESLDSQLMPTHLVQIMYEATRDRFQGYPQYDDDSQVPFRDATSGRNMYPIIGDPMPLDWQIEPNVNSVNFQEHLQSSRWEDVYKARGVVSTVNAAFIMQGMCDVNEMDPTSGLYWPNCTDANNDISTGGVERPVSSAQIIHRKSSDLVPLVKAIFEAKEQVRNLGLFFKSMGAGASLNYPAYHLDTHSNYTSVGCDWMKAPNPYDPSRPIATQEEIDLCHPQDDVVSNRVYNPLERAWCRDQALQPEKVILDVLGDTWDEGRRVLSVGRAVYDRQTDEFVACIFVGISLSVIEEQLQKGRVTQDSALSVVRFDKVGTVVASSVTAERGEANTQVYLIDELELGLTEESYQDLYKLVDYDSKWDPQEVRGAYKKFSLRDQGFFLAASPVPPVPDEYDAAYRPEFLVLTSAAEAAVFNGVNAVNDDVHEQVQDVVILALLLGAIGFGVCSLIVFLMSNALTAPLRYMNEAAGEIVGNFGALKKEKKQAKELNTFEGCCTPRTELTDVVKEFNKMVTNFSGSMLAKTEKGTRVEVRNQFDMRKEFLDLYSSREKSTFAYKIGDGNNHGGDDLENHGFIHPGSNLVSSGTVTTASRSHRHHSHRSETVALSGKPRKRWFSSPLFLWTVALIVTPLLLTTITISAVVMYTISDKFDRSVNNAKEYFISAELVALKEHATLKADIVTSVTAASVRDLYLLTRYYGWLVFGGLTMADSFTELISGIEECKAFSDDFTKCPYVQESPTCEDFTDGSRRSQSLYFFNVESNDALPDGDRNVSSFPLLSNSPESTAWWDNATQVPGWEKGASAGGYDTLYDRLRVSSAMPLYPVLYNYDVKSETYIAQYVTFEADGLFMGYVGCDTATSTVPLSDWQSTEQNGAAKLRPELCPVGKYGYDPR